MAFKIKNQNKIQYKTVKVSKNSSLNKINNDTENPYNPWNSIYKNDFNQNIKDNNSSSIINNNNLKTTKDFKNNKIEDDLLSGISDSKYKAVTFPNLKCRKEIMLDKLITENKSYLTHKGYYCICGFCICGTCKCVHNKRFELPANINNNLKSIYKSDFIPKKEDFRINFKPEPILKNNLKNPENKSIYMIDYLKKGTPYDNLLNYKIPVKLHKSKMPGITSYNQNFIDYKSNNRIEQLRPIDDGGVSDKIPMNMRSTNKDYGDFTDDQFKDTIKNNKDRNLKAKPRNPLGPNIPLTQESTMRHYHKRMSLPKTQMSSINHSNTINNIRPFNGLYKTTYMDYDYKKKSKCPAKIIIENIKNNNDKDLMKTIEFNN